MECMLFVLLFLKTDYSLIVVDDFLKQIDYQIIILINLNYMNLIILIINLRTIFRIIFWDLKENYDVIYHSSMFCF